MALFDSRQSQFSVIKSVEEIPDNTIHMIQRTNRSKHLKPSITCMAECYPEDIFRSNLLKTNRWNEDIGVRSWSHSKLSCY